MPKEQKKIQNNTKSKRNKTAKKNKRVFKVNREIIGVLLFSLSILTMLAIYFEEGTVGKFGILMKHLIKGLLGNLSGLILPIFFMVIAVLLIANKIDLKVILKFGKILLLFVFISAMITVGYYRQDQFVNMRVIEKISKLYQKGIEGYGGGALGAIVALPLMAYFKKVGALILILTFAIIDCMLITEVSLQKIFSKSVTSTKKKIATGQAQVQKATQDIKSNIQKIDIKGLPDKFEREREKTKELDLNELLIDDSKNDIDNSEKKPRAKVHAPKPIEQNNINHDLDEKLNKDIESYDFPPLYLLKSPEKNDKETSDLKEDAYRRAEILVETLESFKIKSQISNIALGPNVTQYELVPERGVKVSKIVNLADDIALSLAAPDVRIEAPIPGKAAIGIEVPNKYINMVYLKEIIDSKVFKNNKSKLTFALGKNISGKCIVADIAKMPHLLIAGATGSGKSVCVNNLIVSLLYNASPSEVKIMLIDPKRVELNVYNGIPHLLIPVVTDARKAAGALIWAVNEMTNRYNIFVDNNVKDIESYNRHVIQYNKSLKEGEEPKENMPQIVIVIDELADLMMVAPSEVEQSIARLAQMSRAAGMHLVLATQRPSVNVITGLIKANIPSRISFAVSSQIDSRTILDSGGAEKLLGRGDMLYNPVGAKKPIRLQGAFITNVEVESIVDYLISKEAVNYNDDIVSIIEEEAPEENPTDNSKKNNTDCDELLEEAIKIVVQDQQASVSMLQRKLRVGYSRAGRLIDEMHERNIVGPHLGSKPRKVLISIEDYYQMQMEDSINDND